MTDRNENEKNLSFKEQILRDLENLKSEIKDKRPLSELQPNSDELAKKTNSQKETVQKEAASREEGNSQPQDLVYPSIEEMMALQEQLEQAKEPADTPLTTDSKDDNQTEAKKGSIPVRYAQTASAADSQVTSPVSRNPAVKVPHSEIVAKAQNKAKEMSQPSKELVRTSRNAKKKRRNRMAGRIVASIVILILLLLGVTGYVGYNYINSALQPIDKTSKEFVTVEIPTGSSSKAIGTVLEKAGLIRNATVFNYYTQLRNYSGFQSGYYNLKKSMSVDQLAKELQKGGTETPQPPVIGKVTIPEGYTLTQIASAVQEATKKAGHEILADTFMSKAQDETFISQMITKYPRLLTSLPNKDSGVLYRLEGYLFPATYDLGEKTTAEDLLEQMLLAMDTNLSPYYEKIAAQNETVNEVLTLASLVEKEGSTDEDRRNIASVFLNRLAQGMPLQSNIAILYAQGKLGEKTTLAEDAQVDTNIDSPYNVYKATGLMPGPVDSPSLSAITAVIEPTTTDYLYFVADVKTGKVYFANNFAEHEQNVQTYVNSQLNF